MITIRSRTVDGRLVIREWQSEAEMRTCWERESASLQTELIQLVVQDGLVLYSGLDPAQLILGGPLWWKDLIHWFSPVVETNAREPDRKELIGARAIRPAISTFLRMLPSGSRTMMGTSPTGCTVLRGRQC